MEGGDVGVGAYVSRGASKSHQIGQHPAGQQRECPMSLQRHDQPGHSSVHHVVPQRIQYKLEPKVHTLIRAAGGGRIGSILFIVDRAVCLHFTEQL